MSERSVDPEIQALEAAVDAFRRVDRPTAERMLAYLWQRFVTDAAKTSPGEKR